MATIITGIKSYNFLKEPASFHCAPEIVNCIEEKGRKVLKHSMLNETLL